MSHIKEENVRNIEYLCGTSVEIIKIDSCEFKILSEIIFGNNHEKLSDIIIRDAIKKKSTDIHFEPEEENVRIRYRINGCMATRFIIEKEKYYKILSKIKVLGNMDMAEKRRPQDGKIIADYDEIKYDLRISTIPVVFGEKMVIRILYCRNFNLNIKELNFNEKDIKIIEKINKISSGLLIVNGPTSSGKSTTLYTMLNEMSRENVNIMTIEDPVEAYIKNINQMSVNNELNVTFSSGLRSLLRQDPDIIMIGEIRDTETAQIAVRASITGHKVLSTIHCRSPREVFLRFNSMGIQNDILFECLKGIISQRLIRVLCNNCKEKMKNIKYKNRYVFRKCGCEKCNYTGYAARKLVSSVYYLNDEVKTLRQLLENPSNFSNKPMLCQMENMLFNGNIDYDDFLNFIEGEKLYDEA